MLLKWPFTIIYIIFCHVASGSLHRWFLPSQPMTGAINVYRQEQSGFFAQILVQNA